MHIKQEETGYVHSIYDYFTSDSLYFLINCFNVNVTYFCALNSRSVDVRRLNGLLNLHLILPWFFICCNCLHFIFIEPDTDRTCFLDTQFKMVQQQTIYFVYFVFF